MVFSRSKHLARHVRSVSWLHNPSLEFVNSSQFSIHPLVLYAYHQSTPSFHRPSPLSSRSLCSSFPTPPSSLRFPPIVSSQSSAHLSQSSHPHPSSFARPQPRVPHSMPILQSPIASFVLPISSLTSPSLPSLPVPPFHPLLLHYFRTNSPANVCGLMIVFSACPSRHYFICISESHCEYMQLSRVELHISTSHQVQNSCGVLLPS
ncbi:hypothetical protein DFH08DRAFT_896487 [Mycena albidolilacea]|uniref:Uncharacterized protein n=1 Tax=Mycena albidolilacea TaxID=1033008 RepID=A0AAD6Z9V6_9AGAR|nr:hypothetical protein DFH08DRAFT_896487 [Mycena albidolilacea]